MLNEVDRSLRSLIQEALPDDGGPPSVSFAPPTPEWTAAQDGRVVNLFLYDVREDLDGQSSDEVDVRDGEGRVIGRQRPPRKYQLSYLASAWCGDAEVEHELLGAILATVPNEPAIPADHLAGRLLDQGLPVRVKVGTPVTGANTWDLWAALGTPPRTAIEIVVTATLVPELSTDLEPPALEFELGVNKEEPGAIGPESEPVPSPAPEAAPPKETKDTRSSKGRSGKQKTDQDATPAPELEARPGKRWTTFRVREEAVPSPAD